MKVIPGVNSYDTYRMKYLMKVRPDSLQSVGMCLSYFQALILYYTTTKTFINGLRLLDPSPIRCLTAEQAPSYSCFVRLTARSNRWRCDLYETLVRIHAGAAHRRDTCPHDSWKLDSSNSNKKGQMVRSSDEGRGRSLVIIVARDAGIKHQEIPTASVTSITG